MAFPALSLALLAGGLAFLAYGAGRSKGESRVDGVFTPETPKRFTPDMLPSGTPYLREGSRGPEVVKWQEFLLYKGYPLRGGADGIFGPSTFQHTSAFQTKAGIAADGIVGPQTIAAARASL